MEDIYSILRDGLLIAVDEVQNCMYKARDLAAECSDDLNYEDLSWESVSRAAEQGLKRCVNRRSSEDLLIQKLLNVQEALQPLFEGDRGIGYFSCIQFEGPFPWETESASLL